ncbi:hypothetical protein K505DRAFT_415371 [Melanomma pulvis-pyrius CBS 109.77]|uniref:Uncharacterized protein n=1 Tax=Melanomma pulvis-pyrius CBS 109.77 TaxID=1314802 RepID=A0A6A6XKK0_9PLEO|nr:hypothetical protein K505DRAFT_415371 [Melanomma pulvis-pyrius CBS 109.77]
MYLRHKNLRHAPRRYQGDGTYSGHSPSPPKLDDDETFTSSGPASSNPQTRHHSESQPDFRRSSPPHSPLEKSPAPNASSPHNQAAASVLKEHPDTQPCKMANIKKVRTRNPDSQAPARRRGRPKAHSHDASSNSDLSDSDTNIDTNEEPGLVITSGKPAAFPSLEHIQNVTVPILGEVSETQQGRHGVERLMNDRFREGQKVKQMYTNKRFPSDMSTGERKWYTDLKACLQISDNENMISFHSLWPSLRQTIMDEIADECVGVYNSNYYPVVSLLNINTSELSTIIKENNELFYGDDELPAHILELKRQFPNDPIDPDTPPPQEIVKAIKYLMQNHLPCSLLGEWQFPMPRVEAFNPLPTPTPTPDAPEPLVSSGDGISVNPLIQTSSPSDDRMIPKTKAHKRPQQAEECESPQSLKKPTHVTSSYPPSSPARGPRESGLWKASAGLHAPPSRSWSSQRTRLIQRPSNPIAGSLHSSQQRPQTPVVQDPFRLQQLARLATDAPSLQTSFQQQSPSKISRTRETTSHTLPSRPSQPSPSSNGQPPQSLPIFSTRSANTQWSKGPHGESTTATQSPYIRGGYDPGIGYSQSPSSSFNQQDLLIESEPFASSPHGNPRLNTNDPYFLSSESLSTLIPYQWQHQHGAGGYPNLTSALAPGQARHYAQTQHHHRRGQHLDVRRNQGSSRIPPPWQQTSSPGRILSRHHASDSCQQIQVQTPISASPQTPVHNPNLAYSKTLAHNLPIIRSQTPSFNQQQSGGYRPCITQSQSCPTVLTNLEAQLRQHNQQLLAHDQQLLTHAQSEARLQTQSYANMSQNMQAQQIQNWGISSQYQGETLPLTTAPKDGMVNVRSVQDVNRLMDSPLKRSAQHKFEEDKRYVN